MASSGDFVKKNDEHAVENVSPLTSDDSACEDNPGSDDESEAPMFSNKPMRTNDHKPRVISAHKSAKLGPNTKTSASETTLDNGTEIVGDVKYIRNIQTPECVMCCRYNFDGSLIAAGMKNGTVIIYSTDTGKPLYHLSDLDSERAGLPCTDIKFKPVFKNDRYANLLLTTYASGDIKFWHPSSKKPLKTIHEDRQTLGSCFDLKGKTYITCGNDEILYVRDLATNKVIETYQPSYNSSVIDGHSSRVFTVKNHPNDENIFISGGWDDTVQVWDRRAKHSVRKFVGPHVCGESLDIEPTSGNLLAGSWRKHSPIQIFDWKTTQLIKDSPVEFPTTLIYCCKWLGKDKLVHGGCESNLAQILDRSTMTAIGMATNCSGGVYCLDSMMSLRGNTYKVAFGNSNYITIMETRY